MASEKKPTTTQSIVSLIVFFGMLWFFFGGGWEQMSNKEMQTIYDKVASDSVEQYNIAKAHGNRTDICVHAGMVKAGYLQAKDEANFQTWTSIEAADCAYMGAR